MMQQQSGLMQHHHRNLHPDQWLSALQQCDEEYRFTNKSIKREMSFV